MADDPFVQGVKAYQTGDLAIAESAFREVLSFDPYSSEAMLNLGNVYYKQKRIQDAEDQWLKTLEINPMEEKAYLNLGNLYFAEQSNKKAIYNWEIFLKLDPLHPHIHLNMGLAYEALGEIPKAFQHYNLYLRSRGIGPEGEQLKARIAEATNIAEHNIKYAEAFMRAGQLENAQKAFEQSINLIPLNPSIYKHYASVLYRLKEYEEACQWYEKAHLQLPGDTTILINLGIIYEKLGNMMMSLWAYSTSIKLNPGATPLKVRERFMEMWDKTGETEVNRAVEQIQEFINQKEYKDAERLSKRVFDMAIQYQASKTPELKRFIDFLEGRQDPKRQAANIAYSLAEEMKAAGQYEKALRFYERYLKYQPEGDKAEEVKQKQEEITKIVSAVVGNMINSMSMGAA